LNIGDNVTQPSSVAGCIGWRRDAAKTGRRGRLPYDFVTRPDLVKSN
jgi:hypothetical protein